MNGFQSLLEYFLSEQTMVPSTSRLRSSKADTIDKHINSRMATGKQKWKALPQVIEDLPYPQPQLAAGATPTVPRMYYMKVVS